MKFRIIKENDTWYRVQKLSLFGWKHVSSGSDFVKFGQLGSAEKELEKVIDSYGDSNTIIKVVKEVDTLKSRDRR